MKKNSRVRKGAVLVEMLIGSVICAVIGAAVLGAFACGVRLFSHIKDTGAGVNVLLGIYEFEKDVKNVRAYSDAFLAGTEDEICLPAIIRLEEDGRYREYPGFIKYSFDGGENTLYKTIIKYPDTEIRAYPLINDAHSVAFSYADISGESIEWIDFWKGADLPLGVKITVSFEGGGAERAADRTIFIPAAGGTRCY